jgi:hypothetical protein
MVLMIHPQYGMDKEAKHKLTHTPAEVKKIKAVVKAAENQIDIDIDSWYHDTTGKLRRQHFLPHPDLQGHLGESEVEYRYGPIQGQNHRRHPVSRQDLGEHLSVS